MTSKILIIVPAYNESANIADVIISLNQQHPDCDVLVVDDGSTDSTFNIANTTGKCRVVKLFLNLGIGGAVQTGFKFAHRNNYDIAIQFDGDGQHIADEINILVGKIQNGFDVVIGSRFIFEGKNFRSSFFRRLGISLFMIVNSILIKQKITDNTSGFRAFNKNAINFLAFNYPEDYPEPEAVVMLGKNRFKIAEVPVRMNSRKAGKSSIAGLSYFYYFFKVFLAVILTNFRPVKRYDNG